MYLENGILKGRCTCFNATRRETQNKQLLENIVGRARMGSAEGRTTGGEHHRVPREGVSCHGSARFIPLRTGTSQFRALASEADDADDGRSRSPSAGGVERCGSGSVGVQPGVVGGSIRLVVLLCSMALSRSNARRGWRVFRWRMTVLVHREGVGRRGAHPLGVRSCR